MCEGAERVERYGEERGDKVIISRFMNSKAVINLFQLEMFPARFWHVSSANKHYVS